MLDPVFEAIACAVATTFNCDRGRVTPDTESSDIDGWDSLSHVYLILNVEERLGITLPLEAMLDCANVGALAKLARRHAGPGTSA